MAELAGIAMGAKKQLQRPRGAPGRDDNRVREARRQQLLLDASRRGRQSTILTGGSGLSDEPLLGKATLLGG